VSFNSKDLDAFLLTEKGLLLLFQNYVVSGYDDHPMTLLIPYNKLASVVNPDSPLPVDHTQLMEINPNLSTISHL